MQRERGTRYTRPELNYRHGCTYTGTHTLSFSLPPCLSPERDSLQASHNCLIRRVCEVQMPWRVPMPRINYRIRLIPMHVWRAYIPYRRTVAANMSAANNRELRFPPSVFRRRVVGRITPRCVISLTTFSSTGYHCRLYCTRRCVCVYSPDGTVKVQPA